MEAGEHIVIERLESIVPMKEYAAECVDIPRFSVYCRECPGYGKSWSCPPFKDDPMEIWMRFEALHLYAYILPNAPGQTVAAALSNLNLAKKKMLGELLERERALPGSFALSVGTCTLCGDVCSRTEGKPCRNPAQMRHSIESLGGDVAKTAVRYFDKPLLWIQNNVLPEYLMLVGGLLLQHWEG